MGDEVLTERGEPGIRGTLKDADMQERRERSRLWIIATLAARKWESSVERFRWWRGREANGSRVKKL